MEKLFAKALALNSFKPKYTASAPLSTAAKRVSILPAGDSNSAIGSYSLKILRWFWFLQFFL